LEEQFKDGRRLRSSALNSSWRSSSEQIVELEMVQVKKFNWTLVELGEDSMMIQVDFENSGYISFDGID